MESFFTKENIVFIVWGISMIFAVYFYFKRPQINSEKQDALMAQKVQWQSEANERRFAEIQQSIKDAFSLAQNHTHTVEVKVDALTNNISKAELAIAKLSTVIEERIPKK